VRVTVPALLIALAGCASPTPPAGYPEAMLASGFAGSPPELAARVVQDEAQRVCSTTDVAVLRARAPDLAAQARATMRYPSTGRLVGDWRVGEKLALSGVGGRIRNRQVEKGDASGGNCYACHTMSPAEPNAGTLGPSLVGWGRRRGSDALAARYAYESIYNRWAFQPCSAMPRLGASGLLSVEQVAHLVAYLLDPDSPVNR
jgi:sulfur-oxidizing protein SoxX